MLMRVFLTTLTTFLFLAGSAEVIRAAEKLPGGAFTFTSSPDEVNWRPFFLAERATVYRGVNGYAVDLIRIPPDKEVVPNLGLAHLVGEQCGPSVNSGGANFHLEVLENIRKACVARPLRAGSVEEASAF